MDRSTRRFFTALLVTLSCVFLWGCDRSAPQSSLPSHLILGTEEGPTSLPGGTDSPPARESSVSPTESTTEATTEATATPTEAPTAEPTMEPTTEPPTEPPTSRQPGDTTDTFDLSRAEDYPADGDCGELELLEKWMAVEGLTWADLEERDCRQLVLCVARSDDPIRTRTTCYEKGPAGWEAVEGLTRMAGFVGREGVLHDRVVGSYTSPAGLWALGMAFGNEDRPERLKLPWRDVTENSDWVCDFASPYYNTWQERGDPNVEPWDQDEVEHLEDYPVSYAYACVIEFNTPPYTVPERGSAIFFHCASDYTAGCVGLPREDLVATLLWLDPAENPYILVTGWPKA